MKRLNLAICVFGLILSVAGTATANGWQVVYQTDFSTDPGWTTDQPANYYWDAASQTYHIQPEHHYPGYQPSRYAYTLLPEAIAGSFNLRWDIKPTRCDWSIGIYFGIYDETLRNGDFIGGWLGSPDRGHMWDAGGRGVDGWVTMGSSYAGWGFNQWYTCSIDYDAGTQMMTFDVRNRGSAGSIWTYTILLPGGLTNDLKYLGTSSGPMGENGTYPGVNPWAVAEAYIDNVVLSVPGETPSAFLDDFEDGVIDTSLWVVGGRNVSWSPSDPGSWTWSHDEVISDPGDPDGYLRLRVKGPGSGNSYGAIAWLRTTYNFNDGRDYTLNFTWKADVEDSHCNRHYIQVTDGYIPSFQEFHGWYFDSPNPGMDGTIDLLWEIDSQGNPHLGHWYPSDGPKQTWSITISPSAVARLYDGPDATGSLLHEATLNLSKPWFVSLMVADATSAGFPAGDTRLNLYHFAARTLEEGTPPIADAGDDLVADANEQVTLDGSGSSDPDGQIIKYTWKRLPDGVVIYSGPEPTCQTRALGRVEEVIELTVTDDSLATATDTLKIISRTTENLKNQLAAMQSQIDQMQRQNQELRALLDKICSFPPIAQWLRRVAKFGDLNGDGEVNMADFALLTKGWLH